MASKNVRHALTIIGLAHGLADSIEQSYSDGAPKTVRSMTDSVRARCHELSVPVLYRESPAFWAKIERLA